MCNIAILTCKNVAVEAEWRGSNEYRDVRRDRQHSTTDRLTYMALQIYNSLNLELAIEQIKITSIIQAEN